MSKMFDIRDHSFIRRQCQTFFDILITGAKSAEHKKKAASGYFRSRPLGELDRIQYYACPGDFVSILLEQGIMSPYFFHIVSWWATIRPRSQNKLALAEGFYRGKSLSEIGQLKIYFGQA
jgi:hypothetical protein